MCGIAGILYTNDKPVSSEVIQNMTANLSHRGPDGEGIYLRDSVALGHRRLSIIDLAGGKQPLSNENEQIWITFNGEIYNYKELRRQLEPKGHRFKTHSDTETIVHAYEEWGDSCVTHFRGMFAFAIADFKNKRVFLARDHLGIKPLYYIHNPRYFAFASELRALKQIPDFEREVDLQAIDLYLWLQYIPDPKTIFKNVLKLPPGHQLSVSFDGQSQGPKKYWELEFRPDLQKTENEWIEALENTLKESVDAHLVSDVPFGAFLSGGLDSSTVVMYMSQILKRPVQTFSIGFEEQEFDESKYAQMVAKQCGTQHRLEIIKPNALAILPELVSHYGEPFGDSSAIPTYYVSKVARESVPMVLSGDGGDEAFGGYDSYEWWLKWLNFYKVPRWKRLLYPFAKTLMAEVYARDPELKRWFPIVAYLQKNMRERLWRPEYKNNIYRSIDILEQFLTPARKYSPLNMARYTDLKTYLPYDILTKVDRASMMHGLEVRTPFVDINVVSLAATIPESMLVQHDRLLNVQRKIILKKLLQKYFPDQFINRPKRGFSIPVRKWLTPSGAWGREIHERISGPYSRLHKYFVPSSIQTLINNRQSRHLWLLLFLDEWLKQNT